MQVTVTSSSKKMIAKLQRKEQRKGQAAGAKGSVADQDMELLQVCGKCGESAGLWEWEAERRGPGHGAAAGVGKVWEVWGSGTGGPALDLALELSS